MVLEAGKAAGHDQTTRPVARPTQVPKRWKQFLITVAGVYPLTDSHLARLAGALSPTTQSVRHQRPHIGDLTGDRAHVRDSSPVP
jgi:hypothetical protein